MGPVLYCSMSDVIVGRTPRTLGRAYDDGVIVELVVWIVRNFDVCTIVFTDCLFYYPEIHLPILSIRFRRLHYQYNGAAAPASTIVRLDYQNPLRHPKR